MAARPAGSLFPKTDVAQLGGGVLTLGAPRGSHDWQMVVVYRGVHCPICKSYLAGLEALEAEFNALGVDVVAVSGDPQEKAQRFADEAGISLALGYDLSVAQMQDLGLYISSPRSEKETDRPFAEPAVFVINGEGAMQIIDVTNAPFVRPDLQRIANGIKFIRANDYPVRGTFTG